MNLPDNWIIIRTLYLDRHNDYIQFYAKQVNDKFLFSDDGETFQDVEQGGYEIDQKILEILDNFGIEIRNETLQIYGDFKTCKEKLARAIKAINDYIDTK